MQRISATTNNPDLLTTAFTDATHSTLIILNRSTIPQHLTINWPTENTTPRWTEIEHTTQTAANQTTPTHPDDLIIQPGEILTLSTFNAN